MQSNHNLKYAPFYFQRETHAKNLQQLKSNDTVESKYSVTLKGI